MVAEKSGTVSRVGVAESPEALVIAADERRAGTDAAFNFHDAAVEPEAELGHGLGLVEILFAEQVAGQLVKNLLRGSENWLVILTASGDIEQPKQNAFGAHTEGVIEISGDAGSVGDSRDLCAIDLGKLADHRLNRRSRLVSVGVKQRMHRR